MSITAVAPSQSPFAIPWLSLTGQVSYVFCALRLCVNGTVLPWILSFGRYCPAYYDVC